MDLIMLMDGLGPSVKRTMSKSAIVAAAMLAATGCSGVNWSRLAPPGIVKYEEIASKKPPNPAIEAQIAERKETGKTRFPNLSETPGVADRPDRRGGGAVAADVNALAAARNQLEAEIEQDREQAEAERTSAGDLGNQRKILTEQVEKDAAAVKSDRQELSLEEE